MRGRKRTTGRFDSRYELEQFIWHRYTTTDLNMAQIARAAHVSETTAHNIYEQLRRARRTSQHNTHCIYSASEHNVNTPSRV